MALDTTTWDGIEEFLEALFGPWWTGPGGGMGSGDGQVWTAAFRSVAAGENWQGWSGASWLRRMGPKPEGMDLYFSVALMGQTETRRSNSGAVVQPVLIVDDVGTKVDIAEWEGLYASGFPQAHAHIETSPGNFTLVWALAEGEGEGHFRSLMMIRAWIAAKGLSDEVLDVARYVRLPGGWNSKLAVDSATKKPVVDPVTGETVPKYPARTWDFGPYASVGLAAWRDPRDLAVGRVDLDDMARVLVPGAAEVMGLGLDWRDIPLPVGSAGAQAVVAAGVGGSGGAMERTADLQRPEPIMALWDAVGGKDLVQVRVGVVEALCPNIGAHTTRADTGFAFLGNGLMQCNHASCQGLRTPDFVGMMMDEYEAVTGEDATAFLAGASFGSAPGGSAAALGAAAQIVAGVQAGVQAAVTAGAAAVVSGVAQAAAAQAAVTQAVVSSLPWLPPAGAGAGASGVVAQATLAAAQTVQARGAALPPRKFLYGHCYIGGFVSLTVGPGGSGKSAMVLVEAVAMATGRELLKGEKPIKPMTVWMHNAEDDREEMERRLIAVLLHYGLDYADLGGRLLMTSGRDMDLVLARMGGSGPEVVPGVFEGLEETVRTRGIEVLILDPLGAMHTLPENSNEAANVIMKALRMLGHGTGAGVQVVHHASKAAAGDMAGAGAGASRGASAFVDGARVVRQVGRMTEKEAALMGVRPEERRDYLRVDNGKANLAPAEFARWRKMVSVGLGNGAGWWPKGDSVGVVVAWEPPSSLSGSPSDLYLVQQAIAAVVGFTGLRADTRAQDWVGWLVARTLGVNAGQPGQTIKDRTPEEAGGYLRVKGLVEGWLRDGGLIRVEGLDEQRHARTYVGVGTPALMVSGVAQQDAEEDIGDVGDTAVVFPWDDRSAGFGGMSLP